MNHFWTPARSSHAPQNHSLPNCKPTRLNYCTRTMWALLGMRRALALRSSWAANRKVVHASVMVMRHDVLWFNQLQALRVDAFAPLLVPLGPTWHPPEPPPLARVGRMENPVLSR